MLFKILSIVVLVLNELFIKGSFFDFLLAVLLDVCQNFGDDLLAERLSGRLCGSCLAKLFLRKSAIAAISQVRVQVLWIHLCNAGPGLFFLGLFHNFQRFLELVS